MSDELECFRKAAELGCPDFKEHPYTIQNKKIVGFIIDVAEDGRNGTLLPSPIKRWNRYASAVCAEWWRKLFAKSGNNQHSSGEFFIDMMDQARAFGKKYGGEGK